MPLDKLLNQDDLKVLREFKPDVNFKVLGGYDYQIVVFQKVSLPDSVHQKKKHAEVTST
jgi:hypothetical protein